MRAAGSGRPGLGSIAALLRPWNLATLWLAVEAGARLSGGPGGPASSLVPVLTAAFGYARNDALDRAADIQNRPGRPVASGAISSHAAIVFSWALLAIAAAIAYVHVPDPSRWALFGAGAVLLYFYTPRLKSLGPAGPGTVSVLAAMAVFWGGLSGAGYAHSVAAACLAASVTFARECAKDLEDCAGDRVSGKVTWAVRSGEETVRTALRTACVLSLALIPVPWLLGDANERYLAIAGLGAAPILAWCVARAPRARDEAKRASLALKIALIAGIVGLWVGAGAPAR